MFTNIHTFFSINTSIFSVTWSCSNHSMWICCSTYIS